MKTHIISSLILIISLLITFSQVQAGGSDSQTGITIFGGAFKPTLELKVTNSNSNGSPISVDYEEVNAPTKLTTMGIGLLSRGPRGGAVRLLYTYRRESSLDLVVSQNGNSSVVASNALDYSLHDLSLSLMHHFGIIPRLVSLYLGGGVSGLLLTYPEETMGQRSSFGVTGFPLGGLELRIGRVIGFYGEFQYHWGRTLNQNFQPDSSTQQSIHYYYNLEAPHLMAGVNLYF